MNDTSMYGYIGLHGEANPDFVLEYNTNMSVCKLNLLNVICVCNLGSGANLYLVKELQTILL